MPQKIKLTYFNLRGRAELARLVLAQAGVEYEDSRFEREEWPAIKPSIPFGQVPILDVDGTVIIQSMAIARYLAREFKLAGKNNLETALCDMYIDCVTDNLNKAVPIFREKDEAEKAKLLQAFKEEAVPNFLGHMEGALKKNGGKYLVGDGVTIADIAVANTMMEMTKMIGEEWKEKFPQLAKFSTEIMALPKIKSWLEKRPDTPM